MEEQIKTMPVVALRGLTILPKMVMHFDITRPRSMAAVEKAMIGDQRIFLVTQKHHEVVEPELDDLYQVGTIAVVKQMVKLPKHVVRVLVEGLERGELFQPIQIDHAYTKLFLFLQRPLERQQSVPAA